MGVNSDHYEVLGIAKDASKADIKKAYFAVWHVYAHVFESGRVIRLLNSKHS
jgi:preprotein translocase subunit Sec63